MRGGPVKPGHDEWRWSVNVFADWYQTIPLSPTGRTTTSISANRY